MKTENLERYLTSFGKYVITQSRANLTRGTKKYGSKNNTKQLYNSLKFELLPTSEGFTVEFFMADYGTFVDKGVSGKKQIRTFTDYEGKTLNSPYQYRNKMPPPTILDKWIVRRGLAPRTKKGRFKARTIDKAGFAKSIQFLVAKKIQMQGIQGISFFQRPLMLAFEDFNKQVLTAVERDIIDNLTDSGWNVKQY